MASYPKEWHSTTQLRGRAPLSRPVPTLTAVWWCIFGPTLHGFTRYLPTLLPFHDSIVAGPARALTFKLTCSNGLNLLWLHGMVEANQYFLTVSKGAGLKR